MDDAGQQQDQIRFAGFWIRVLADLIDSTLVDLSAVFLTVVLLGIVFWTSVVLGMNVEASQSSYFKDLGSNLIFGVVMFFRGVLSLGYYTWCHYRFGTTLGKKPFGIYVVPHANPTHGKLTLKQSFIRTLNYFTSYVPLGAGFLMVIFHVEKRALHDLLADTVSVIRRSR